MRIVVHGSARDHTPVETIAMQLGPLGKRLIGIAPPRMPRWAAIQRYLTENPADNYRILDDAQEEFPADLPELIVCSPKWGVSEPRVQDEIRSWLRVLS